MTFLEKRRALIRAAVGAAACAPLNRIVFDAASAQSVSSDSRSSADASSPAAVRSKPLVNGLTLFTGAGANVVALVKPEGTVLIDGGLAAHASSLLAALEAQTQGAPVHTLFNTHWHPEQTGLNGPMGRQGIRIVAHENTRLWLGTDIVRPAERFEHSALPEHARPNESFRTEGELRIGSEPIAYRHLPQAHTDGDLYVHFPRSNVFAVGDLVTVGRYPTLDYATGGFLPGLVQATKTLLELTDDESRIVPAQGPVQGRAHLVAQFEMLSAVLEGMIDRLYRGFSARDMLEDGVTEPFDEVWGDPEQFVVSAYKGMWGHVREFEGIV